MTALNVFSVACPTCDASVGMECGDLVDGPMIGAHVGRVRIARAAAAGETLNYRRFSEGWWNIDSPDGEYLGIVNRFMDEGWTVTAADGTIITRGWKGTLATAAGFLVDRLEPLPIPERVEQVAAQNREVVRADADWISRYDRARAGKEA